MAKAPYETPHLEGFDTTRETSKSFDETVAAVERLTAEKGFRVLHVHDIAGTLREKGFERGPMKVIEVCNAKYAHDVLAREPRISTLLPCPISVWTEGGKTKVCTVLPTVMIGLYPGAGVDEVARLVEDAVLAIVDGAVST